MLTRTHGFLERFRHSPGAASDFFVGCSDMALIFFLRCSVYAIYLPTCTSKMTQFCRWKLRHLADHLASDGLSSEAWRRWRSQISQKTSHEISYYISFPTDIEYNYISMKYLCLHHYILFILFEMLRLVPKSLKQSTTWTYSVTAYSRIFNLYPVQPHTALTALTAKSIVDKDNTISDYPWNFSLYHREESESSSYQKKSESQQFWEVSKNGSHGVYPSIIHLQ